MLKNLLRISAFIGLVAVSSVSLAAQQTVTLAVPDMTCAACPITVKKALMRVDGVLNTKVSYERREAVVTFDDSKTSAEKLAAATANAGYPSTVKAEK
jgi:mercuric ion binding protein